MQWLHALAFACLISLALGNDAMEDEAELMQVSLLQNPSVRLQRSPLQGAEDQRSGQEVLPSFTVDLDLPPEQRWFSYYRAHRDKYMPQLEASAPKPSQLQRLRDFLSSINLDEEKEFLAEYRGILNALNDSRVTLEMLLWNEMSYERGTTMGCTGVLAATPNGTVFHGRNLDLSAGKFLVPSLIEVTFARGGVPLFLATTFVGTVGIHTGHRFGSWSVAQNTRKGCNDLAANEREARAGGRPFMLYVRRLMQEVPDFETAVQRLAEAHFMAPQYFTVAGPGPFEGALVTRDRKGNAAPYGNVLTLSPAIGRWYIVQTNDDVWEPPVDGRRPAALAKLQHMLPGEVGPTSVGEIMMTVPVLNPGTVFTWVYCPLTGMRKMLLGYEELESVTLRNATS